MRSNGEGGARISVRAAMVLLAGGAVACLGGDGGGERGSVNAGSTTDGQPGARLLFSSDTGGIARPDQDDIWSALGLEVSDDGSRLVDGTCGQPVTHAVRFEDLNHDGAVEVFIDYGNACISGMAGTSVMLFVRDVEGRFQPRLGVPGLIAEVRSSEDADFPDLLIGGPGFCFPVWGWDGETYVHLRNEPQAARGCAE